MLIILVLKLGILLRTLVIFKMEHIIYNNSPKKQTISANLGNFENIENDVDMLRITLRILAILRILHILQTLHILKILRMIYLKY